MKADLPGVGLLRYARRNSDFPETEQKRTDRFKRDLKRGVEATIQEVVTTAGAVAQEDLRKLFRDAAVIPVPGSQKTVLANRRNLALATHLAEEFGARPPSAVLERASPILKSAGTSRADRPSVMQQFESLRAGPFDAELAAAVKQGRPVILVDDTLTMGRTTFAAAARLRERAPESKVVAFAPMYTPFPMRDFNKGQSSFYEPRTAHIYLGQPEKKTGIINTEADFYRKGVDLKFMGDIIRGKGPELRSQRAAEVKRKQGRGPRL